MRLPLNTPSDDEKTNGVHLEVGPIISHEEETFQSISEEHKTILFRSMVLGNCNHYRP